MIFFFTELLYFRGGGGGGGGDGDGSELDVHMKKHFFMIY